MKLIKKRIRDKPIHDAWDVMVNSVTFKIWNTLRSDLILPFVSVNIVKVAIK